MRRRFAVVGVVPGLVQAFDPGAHPEPEAAARHLVDVEGADRVDEGAAGEGPDDPGGDPDPLGLRRQVGGLGDGAAEQLRRPDALDAGRLGPQRLRLEVGDRGADRGDGDAVERAHRPRQRQALAGAVSPARTASATRSRCHLASPKHRRVGAAALEEEVEVVLPGEADAAVDLDRRVGDAPAGVGGVGLRHRGGQRQRLGLGVGGPGGAVDGGARVLGLQQHLRAAVGDRLVGADRAAELLAVFGVGDRHLQRPLGDPGRLGGERDAGAVEDRL